LYTAYSSMFTCSRKKSENNEGQWQARYPYWRREGDGRNTRGEIIWLLEVSPGDSGGHSVPIDQVGVADGLASWGHSRIHWVCHDGSFQFVVTGDTFFSNLLKPYLPPHLLRVSCNSGLPNWANWITLIDRLLDEKVAKNISPEKCVFCLAQTENWV